MRRIRRRYGHVRIAHDNLWLCSDCTIAEVNGDYSGIEYSGGEKRVKEVEEGIERLVKRVGPLSPNFDSETGEGIKEFSSQRCDACGTRLAGERDRFVAFER